MRAAAVVVVLFAANGLWAAEGLAPSEPAIPAKIRELLQDRKFAEAVQTIDEAAKAKDAPRDYYAYLRAQSLFNAQDYPAAAEAFEAFDKEFPRSPWARRAKFGFALAKMRAGDFRTAELVYRDQVNDLLSVDRKQQIADIYLEFATQSFKPPKENDKPDYAKALEFYRKALEVGPNPEKRIEVELLVAQCLRELDKRDEAIPLFTQFAKEHPTSPLVVEALYRLGELQLKQNQPQPARKTWQDLITDHPDAKSERIAEAAFNLSDTYLTAGATDADLAIASLESFLKRFPDHKLASEAHLKIGQLYMGAKRPDKAATALEQFLADKRYQDRPEIPKARQLLGFAYLSQRKFPEALAAWRDYLAKHPSHEGWSSVQSNIVKTEYLMGLEKRQAKEYAKAIELWTAFLNKYPLDEHAAPIMLQFGQMDFEQGNWELAIAAWRRVIAKYPESDEAGSAQMLIALTIEEKLGKLDEALKEYRKITQGAYQSQAQQRIARLTAKSMDIATERIFRGDETPKIKLTTRNIDAVTVQVYSVDLETYFRKMHAARGVEGLDIALIDPDTRFEFKVPKYAELARFESEIPIELPKSKDAKAGVLAVTVSSKTLEATTMVLQSDLDIVVKSSRDEVFVFAQNLRTGKPWAGARLLISNGKEVFAEGQTGADGVFSKSFAELKDAEKTSVLAVADGHFASNVLALEGLNVASGLAATGYIYTDRPAYRAGQVVHVRGVVRQVSAGAYIVPKGKKYTLQIFDPRNRSLSEQQVTLNEFGSFHANLTLPAAAAAGDYRVLVNDEDKESYQGTFAVHEYQLEPIHLSLDLDRRVFYRGENIEGKIRAAFYYGAPLAGKEIRYRLADQPIQTATTDAAGEVKIKLPTRDFREDQVLQLIVELPERSLGITESLFVATRGYSIGMSTVRPVYLAGESFEVEVTTKTPDGKPTDQKLKLHVYELTNVDGKIGERLLETKEVETAKETGIGRATLKLDKGGRYGLRAEGTDRFGNPVANEHALLISDNKDPTKLRILADRHTYKVGDTAKIRVHWRKDPALALVTYQGARVLGYRLVELKNGENTLDIPMTASLAPNFDLAIDVMTDDRRPVLPNRGRDGEADIKTPQLKEPDGPLSDIQWEQNRLQRFHQAASPFTVQRDLKLTVATKRKGNAAGAIQPGEEIEVSVTATDAQGKPVVAEMSLAMVEQALLDRFDERVTAIDDFFRGERRVSQTRTTASILFDYKPTTTPINPRLLAEADRLNIADEESKRLAAIALDEDEKLDAELAQVRRSGSGRSDLRRSQGGLGGGGGGGGLGFGAAGPTTLSDLLAAEESSVSALGVPNIEVFSDFDVDGISGENRWWERLNEAEKAAIPVQKPASIIDARRGGNRQVPLPGDVIPGETDFLEKGRTEAIPGQPRARVLSDKAAKGQVGRFDPAMPGMADSRNAEDVTIRRRKYKNADLGSTMFGTTPNTWNARIDQPLLQGAGVEFQAPATPQNVQMLLAFGVNESQVLQKNGVFLHFNLADPAGADNARKLGEQGASLIAGMGPQETAYWNPAIVTDKEGKATVTLTVPQRSTAWKLRAKGITEETLAGEATSELTVKKDLFGELKLPLAFTDGDEAEVIATVHNDALAEGNITVELATTIGDKSATEKQTIPVKAKGLNDVVFKSALKLPADRRASTDVDAVFELAVTAGDKKDVLRRVVPIRPYGMPVYVIESGSATGDMTVFVEPSKQMGAGPYSLQLLIGPTVEQSLLDVVLGQPLACQIFSSNRLASGLDSATSDLIASIGLLRLIDKTSDAGGPRSQAVDSRIRSALSLLVAAQNEDSGWSWTGRGGASNRYSTARVVWALSLARAAGYKVAPDMFNKAIVYLQSQVAALPENDLESRAVLLHALSVAGQGDFTLANRLFRDRPALSNAGLGYLALALLEMERDPMAVELLGLLGKRNFDRPEGRIALPWNEATAEVRALYCLALQKAKSEPTKAKEQVDWLLAHRTGHRWVPEKATGPAALALSEWFTKARFQGEHYKLAITVNGGEVKTMDVDPASGTVTVDVPAKLLDKSKQRIAFRLTGRGRFTYQAILGAFVPADQLVSASRDWVVYRYHEPAPLERDGKEVPRGFGVLQGSYTTFRNPLTQLPVGKRGHVELSIGRNNLRSNTPDEQLEYLVVTEPLPSGVTVIEQSVKGGFERFEIEPGAITFYVGSRRHIETIHFDVHGYVPGSYRAAPTVVQDAYRPDRFVVSKPKTLTVLPMGAKSGDEYRLTPQELFELGKADFAKQDWKAATGNLSELISKWNLQPEFYKETAKMLLDAHLQIGPPAEIVRYFEIVKEKWPDLEVPFASIVKVGAAYHEMGEYERSFLVFRATAESSFERETGVAGFLEAQGEFVRSVEVMRRLLREYPPEAYAAAASYALAQRVYAKAPEAAADAKLREAKINRVDLIQQAIGMLDTFLNEHPDDPAADEAAFAVANALLDLKLYREAIARCQKYAERYPKGDYLDSYWYVIGYSHFALGEHREALEMCRKVARTKRVDKASGREVESTNKWRAIYILGQVYHSLGQAAEAIREYTQVAERYADAKQAIEYFARKEITLPEITTIKPGEAAKIELKFRNVARCDVKVYRIDLMKFSLLQSNLQGITNINLAGIRPLHEEDIELGDGKDYRDRTKELALPIKEEGAYLVVCRGAELHASGLAVVTPLVVDIQEEAPSGRVRTTVKNALKDNYVHDVHVKVIGGRNKDFVSGATDLRGIFIADGIQGKSTVIAQADGDRYAFYRGKLELGPPPAPPAQAAAAAPAKPNEPGQQEMDKDDLLRGLRQGNSDNQKMQQKELKKLYERGRKGVEAKRAF